MSTGNVKFQPVGDRFKDAFLRVHVELVPAQNLHNAREIQLREFLAFGHSAEVALDVAVGIHHGLGHVVEEGETANGEHVALVDARLEDFGTAV